MRRRIARRYTTGIETNLSRKRYKLGLQFRSRNLSHGAVAGIGDPGCGLSRAILLKIATATSSSVSTDVSTRRCAISAYSGTRRARQRPTDDLPAPIIPMRTIDLPQAFTAQYLINAGLSQRVCIITKESRAWRFTERAGGSRATWTGSPNSEFAGANESNALQFAHA